MNQEEQKQLNKKMIDAVLNGHINLVKYLVEKGVDIYVKDEEPLRLATKNGYLEVVKYLISQGADIYALNDYVLKLASLHNQIKIIQYFLFDCQMKIKQDTKDWLIKYNKKEVLDLIEKRDSIMKNYENLEKLKRNDFIDNFNKKIKI